MKLGFKARYFNPESVGRASEGPPPTVTVKGPERRPSYVYNADVILAVNLALATERPLLVTGYPGTGKTTLANNIAFVLGWRYYQTVVTSRTRARDLMWTFDSLRRLSDAVGGRANLRPRPAYVEPQVLWWAFDRASAAARGTPKGAPKEVKQEITPANDPNTGEEKSQKAVVLLDEIDKADPDVPNDLLEALDAGSFTVDDLDEPLKIAADRSKILLVITSNGERDLPPAFMRRCVLLALDDPDEKRLAKIADERFGTGRAAFHLELAEHVVRMRTDARTNGRRGPSTAEYLDAALACRDLGIGVGDAIWANTVNCLLEKPEQPR